MDYVIFSIDNDHDLHTKAKFLRQMDTLRAMGKLNDTMKLAIGSYQGKLENSYILTEGDFSSHVLTSGFVDSQETFLYVGRQSLMPYQIKNSKGEVLQEGSLRGHTKLPEGVKDWTYRPDLNLYWFEARELQ